MRPETLLKEHRNYLKDVISIIYIEVNLYFLRLIEL